eukprot:g6385.t1 g6385   contig23:337269-337739(-)
MGAGQSKPSSLTGATSASLSATVISSASGTQPNTTSSSADSSAANESTTTKQESGGCPMKNADGSYRIMPGFSSLIGRMSGHPPVDVSKVNQPIDATGEGVAEVDDDASSNASKAVASSGCPVKHDGGSSSRSFNIFRRGGSGPGSANINDTKQYT